MPAISATSNKLLSNYARGIALDRGLGLAQFLAPIVATGAASGQYQDYSDKNAFAYYSSKRAVGHGRKKIEFSGSPAYFNVAPNGLEIDIDNHELQLAAGADNGEQTLREAKLATLINAQLVGTEYDVWSTLRGAVTATSGVGNWTSSSATPISEIDTIIANIATATGKLANRMVLSLGSWNILRNHPNVTNRFNGGPNIAVSLEQFRSLLINPEIEIRVGVLPYDANKPGKTASNANIIGADVWIAVVSETPDIYDPSFAKTFSVTDALVGGVLEYDKPDQTGITMAVDWSYQTKVTASSAGARITIS